MPASIGVNLRVTGHCRQGGRKYMEDFFSVAYQQTEDEKDLEYAFFGIYDGHGGSEAAAFAKENLMELIVRQKSFWSENDEDVLKAIKEGYIATHYAMWREQVKWPKTASGLPSTAGTTASIAFIRRGKIYIGHVGDSGIVLGYQENDSSNWIAKPLTKDHKPESEAEIQRIEQSGGKVVSKSGVPRVVWNRPKIGHQGPIRRSTPIDEIPFLAVARSLGDLWSYNSQLDEFIVSPDPDCVVIPINTNTFRCLIFGTDGLYNMLSPQMAVHIVQQTEKHNEEALLKEDTKKIWTNPSKCLVEKALERWSSTKMRADNTSVITLLLDPPGPPRAQVLQNRKRESYPDSGLEIVTRFKEEEEEEEMSSFSSASSSQRTENISPKPTSSSDCSNKKYDIFLNYIESETVKKSSTCEVVTDIENIDKTFEPKTRQSLAYDPSSSSLDIEDDDTPSQTKVDENVQIHEISSSSCEIEDHELLDQSKQSKSTKNQHYQELTKIDRPVLRSQNVKNTLQQNKPKRDFDGRGTKRKLSYSLNENQIDDVKKRLRNRGSNSTNNNGQKNANPSTSICKNREWLETSILNVTSSNANKTNKNKTSPQHLRRSIRQSLNVKAARNKSKNPENMPVNRRSGVSPNIARNRLGR